MKKIVSALLVPLVLCITAAFPAEAHAAKSPATEISSGAAVLMDADTGQILFQKNMSQKMYPASITKIMTGMLALKKGELAQKIAMSEEAVFSIDRTSSHIALDVDEEITLEQALYALAIASANEAANGIAESIGGSIGNFVDEMNQAAAEAGAKNTNFVNTNGLHEDNHYTTAYDMAKITCAALQEPRFYEIFGTERYEIPPTNKQKEMRTMWNRNRFLNGGFPYEGILMSKTGWTQEAQHTLVTAAQRGDATLIAVVMKTPTTTGMYKDTAALLDYGFNSFARTTIPKERLAQAAPKEIANGEGLAISVDFSIPEDISLLLPSGKALEDIKITYDEPQMDTDKNQARLLAHISLDPSDNEDRASDFVALDVEMSASLDSPKAEGIMSKGGGQTMFGKILASLLLVAAAGYGLLLLAHRRDMKKRRAKEKQLRERRARERQSLRRQQMQNSRYSDF